jgi:hypothetical protein
MKSKSTKRDPNDFLETPRSNRQRIRDKERLSEDIKYILSNSYRNISNS